MDCTQDANHTACPLTSEITDSARGVKHQRADRATRYYSLCCMSNSQSCPFSNTSSQNYFLCLTETQWNADKPSSDWFRATCWNGNTIGKEVMQSAGRNSLLVNPLSHPSLADYGCWWPASGNSRHHSEHTPDASLLSHWSTLPLLEHARWICSWLSSSANKKVYRFYPVHQALLQIGDSWNSLIGQSFSTVLIFSCQILALRTINCFWKEGSGLIPFRCLECHLLGNWDKRHKG